MCTSKFSSISVSERFDLLGAFRGSFVFLAVTNVYFRPTSSLTHLKPTEGTRDSKKMLLKIKIDEEERGNDVVLSP